MISAAGDRQVLNEVIEIDVFSANELSQVLSGNIVEQVENHRRQSAQW